MRYVYKLLEMLAEWRRLGKDDFCNLPFAMKMNMEEEDMLRLDRIVTDVIGNRLFIIQKKYASPFVYVDNAHVSTELFKEVKVLSEQLVHCERVLVSYVSKGAEV